MTGRLTSELKSWRAWIPPFRDRRFWAVQAMVLTVAGVHDLVEASGYLSYLGMLYFVPISLFFAPVAYAGLHFGLKGATATTAWIVVITLPNWIFWHTGAERWGVIFQLAIIAALAALVGRKVDEERKARTAAERYEESLRQLAKQLVSAQEHERNRIARELHDDAVQALVVLARRLDELATATEPAATMADQLQEARKLARHAVEAIRRVMRGLRPPVLEDLGLVPALRQLAAEMTGADGPRVAVYVAGRLERLDPECELGLYRIAQEAMCNVMHHARASRAAVCVTFRPGIVRLAVCDDGVGFPRDTNRASGGVTGGLGLLGMAERARSIGGQLRIYSKPGRGTTLLVTVPHPPSGRRGTRAGWAARSSGRP
ncbi:MAG: sensor histidine kinase [Bacillota bacterium]